MIKRTCFIVAAMLVCAVSSGCASITIGQNQSLSVESRDKGILISGAACRLQNNKGTWFVTTPGSVTVHRSYRDMEVSCTHEKHEPGSVVVKSSTKAMAFGNILIGGLIGVAVDVGTGSAYDYPTLISVEFGVLTLPLGVVTLPAAAPVETPDKKD
jgi:hypothetical protein